MAMFAGLRRFFRLDRAADVEKAVNDELDFHFEQKVRELTGRGMSESEARAEAERKFGDVERTRRRLADIDRERVGGERRAEWWGGFAQDLRYALRGLRLKPGFTLGVVLTLALGIGANATMFGIVDRLLLRGPAYLPDHESAHRFYFVRTYDGIQFYGSNTQYKRFLDVKRHTSSFEDITAVFWSRFPIGTEDPREQDVMIASASLWRLFSDARPVIGRFFSADEDSFPNPRTVVVLSHAFWRSQYGGRNDVLGQKLRINTRDYDIIGVAPAGFNGPGLRKPIAFIPVTTGAMEMDGMSEADIPTTYNWSWTEVYARRKAGVSQERANADLTNAFRISLRYQREQNPGMTPDSISRPYGLAGSVLRDRGPQQCNDSKVATWLIGVAAIVLIIACANVGNLLLARAFGRRREIAVRLALGISRARLLTQLMTESLLLAFIGGALGVMMAHWGGNLVRTMLLADAEWTGALADPRVLAFAGIATLVAGVLTGLAPAWHAGRADVANSLKAGVREGTYHRSMTRTGLLVLQGALSVVLLVGAGLFVRSLHNVRNMRIGFDMDRVAYVSLDMRGVTLDSTAALELRNNLEQRARALPFVEQATRNLTVPFWMTMNTDIYVEGIDSTGPLGEFQIQSGSPTFFETMGTRILRGRGITAEDVANSEKVMVVSDGMSKVLWPGQEALGKCITVDERTTPCRRVVGIAEDTYTSDIREKPAFVYYMPNTQFRAHRGGLFVRTRGAAAEQIEALRRDLQPHMPGASYVTVTALSEIVAPQMASFELGATMFTVFGCLALIVAAVGLYSVVAYGVAQRTHELGVRVALGARAPDVIRLVLGEALKLAAIAAAIGTLVALVAGRWVAPLLFNTSARDPLILVAVAIGLLGIAAIASLLPALRASRVDPNVALRAD